MHPILSWSKKSGHKSKFLRSLFIFKELNQQQQQSSEKRMSELCSHHSLPINQICGLEKCRTIMCPLCFANHSRQLNHPFAIILNQSSVDFFINFLDYIVKQLEHFLSLINSSGVTSVFQLSADILNYWDSKNTLNDISKYASEIILSYRTLMLNNRNFVNDNHKTICNLHHPQFFKDIYALIVDKWVATAERLSEQLRKALLINFPQKYIYRRLKLQINPFLLLEIETKKNLLIDQSKQKIFEEHKELAKLSDLQISKVESVIQAKCGEVIPPKQSRITATIDSFYEILLNSQVNLPQNPANQQILAEHPHSTISPNFLPYEALEKHIEQLLMENQRLKQANTQLIAENRTLKDENAKLKSFKFIR